MQSSQWSHDMIPPRFHYRTKNSSKSIRVLVVLASRILAAYRPLCAFAVPASQRLLLHLHEDVTLDVILILVL